jgi:hypothetical protein
MNLNEIKTAVLALPGITAAQVKAEFGDLRKTITWANALEYFRSISIEQIAVNVLVAFCFVYYVGQAVRQWWDTPTANTEGLLLSLRDKRLSSAVSLA